jgi:putative ABC transport system permease protein
MRGRLKSLLGVGSLAARELRRRPARALALAAGVLVAALSFGLLSSETASSRLQVTATVQHNFRSAYDILVRPSSAVGRFEREHHLVDDTFLSGIFGGITMAQYREIRDLPGVSLAAPVANVGYFLVQATLFVPFPKGLRDANGAVYRTSVDWDVHNGLARYPGASTYVYYTPGPITFTSAATGFEAFPGAGRYDVCGGFAESEYPAPKTKKNGVPVFTLSRLQHINVYRSALLPSFYCSSEHLSYTRAAALQSPGHAGAEPSGRLGAEVTFGLPVLIAGIDPQAEAKLVGLARSIDSGRYLREGEGVSRPHHPVGLSPGPPFDRTYPVIASVDTFLDERAELVVHRLQLPDAAPLARLLNSPAAYTAVTHARARGAVARMSISPTAAWRAVLNHFSHTVAGGFSAAYWRVGPTIDHEFRGGVVPRTVPNVPSTWLDASPTSAAVGFSLAPPGAADTWYRHLRVFGVSGQVRKIDGKQTFIAPEPQLVGTFNPSQLRGFSPLSRVPLQTFYPPLASAGDRAARRELGRSPLGPTTNLGGYLAQPPLLLTTIQGALALDNGDGGQYLSHYRYRSGGHSRTGRRLIEAFQGASPAAPISSIQVRVKGVTGPNALSLARIKLVAEQIEARTGLSVDITAGSSPTPVTVHLAAGRFGEPPLTLKQGWVKKDVDAGIVQALDRKDLALFVLVAVVCALFLATATFAGVRQRRRQIAILATLGWEPRSIFSLVLGETALIGLLAGIAACLLTLAIAALASLQVPVLRLGLIVPLAVALALLAGAIPARRAARLSPLEAMRLPTLPAVSSGSVRGMRALAVANVARIPSRSLLAGGALALSVATLALLLGLQLAFRGAVAGDLLGNVVSIDVRSVDVVSTALVVLVGIGTVIDVLITNLRERRRELGSLAALGWSQSDLVRLARTEGLVLALPAAVVGATIGIVIVSLLGGATDSVALAATLAALAGCILTVLALTFPASRLAAHTPARLLAGEPE